MKINSCGLRTIGILSAGLLTFLLATALVFSWLVNRQLRDYEIYAYNQNAPGSYAQLKGYDIHFQLFGSPTSDPGEIPVMLIHGFASSGLEYSRLAPLLADHHSLIIPDLLGFGYSQRLKQPNPALSHRGQAALLKDLLETLGVQQVDVVGASYGGGIAAQFALDYPERVRQLVFIDAEVFGEASNRAYIAYLPLGLNRALTWYALGGGPIAQKLVELSCHDVLACERAGELSRARESITRIQGNTDALIAFSQTPRDQRIPNDLANIAQPSLVVWGERDEILPENYAPRLADILNASLQWIPEAGHTPHIERSELVAALLLDFLSQ